MSVNSFDINNKTIYSNNFLENCFGVLPKRLETSNLEISNYLKNAGFSLRLGAHNSFARITVDEAIEETAIQNTNP